MTSFIKVSKLFLLQVYSIKPVANVQEKAEKYILQKQSTYIVVLDADIFAKNVVKLLLTNLP